MEGKMKGKLSEILEEESLAKLAKPVLEVASKKVKKLRKLKRKNSMNKMKKLKIKLLIAIGVICFVSVLAIGTVAVYAYNSYSDTAKIVNEAGVIFNYNEAQLQPQDQEDFLSGASPVKTNRQFFTAGYQSGGERYATTTDATTYTFSFC